MTAPKAEWWARLHADALHRVRGPRDAVPPEITLDHALAELDVQSVELEMQNQALADTQEQLAQSRARYRELFELAPIPYVILDPGGIVLELNAAASDHFGLERNDLLRRVLPQLVHRGDRAMLGEHLRRVFGAPGPHRCRVRTIHPAGAERHVYVESVRESEDRATCRTVLLDVTAETTAMNALRSEVSRRERAEQRFAAVVDAAVDGIITAGVDGGIETINPSGQRLFGLTSVAPASVAIGALITMPDGSEPEWEALCNAGPRELVGRHRGGHTFPVRVAASEVRSPSGPRLCFIVHDLTDQHSLQKQLARAQRMEALGTLTSGVAHDFNNLLMSISGAADMGLSGLSSSPQVAMQLRHIKQAVQSGAAITRQLLAFSRRRPNVARVFDLHALVDDARRLLDPLLGGSIRLELQLTARRARLYADPEDLKHVLLNLAANARDAMPEGGELTIRTEDAPPAGEGEPRRVALLVTDTGVGMPEDIRGRIFDPFFTTKAPGHGTGLGLSTVFGTVVAAGGTIDVLSAPGEGTTFIMHLPVTDRSLDAPAPSEPPRPNTRAATVLVVEDNPSVRMAMRYYLEEGGHRVLEASTAEEALECCERFSGGIDAAVCDVGLPEVSGAELATEIVRHRRGCAIVLVSGHSTRALIAQGALPEETDVLQKPFEKDALLDAVDRSLRRVVSSTDGRRVLFVDDDEPMRQMVRSFLGKRGFDVVCADAAEPALRALREAPRSFAVLVTDLGLPDHSGDHLIRQARDLCPELRVIVASGFTAGFSEGGNAASVDAHLTKPFEIEELHAAVARLATGAGHTGDSASRAPEGESENADRA